MKNLVFCITLFCLNVFLCVGNSQGGNKKIGDCTLSPETLLNLQNWFNNVNTKIKEDAKIELVCVGANVAEIIGKGAGAAAGAGGGNFFNFWSKMKKKWLKTVCWAILKKKSIQILHHLLTFEALSDHFDHKVTFFFAGKSYRPCMF